MYDITEIAINGYGERIILNNNSGMVLLLTPCCDATGKGSEGGIVCRKCHEEVDPVFGSCAMLNKGLDSVRSWLLTSAFGDDEDSVARTEGALSALFAGSVGGGPRR